MDYPIVLCVVNPTAVQPGLVVGKSAGLIAFRIPQSLETLVDAARDAILGAVRDHAEEQQLREYQQHHNYTELER